MLLQDMIKERRKALNLTQEKVAAVLRVSATAVYKWEKGITCPDIVLLPPLARLLQTDLNSLLCFKEELTDKEIADFINQVTDQMEKDFDKAFMAGVDKVREYPNCEKLLLSVALILNGGVALYKSKHRAKQEKQVEDMLLKAAESSRPEISQQGINSLTNRYIAKGEYEKAQALLNKMPKGLTGYFDPKFIQANLYMKQNNFEEGSRLLEEIILFQGGVLSTAIAALAEAALNQEDAERAKKLAQKNERLSDVLDLWEMNQYMSQLAIATKEKAKEETLALLHKIAEASKKTWEVNQSVLYRHIKAIENNGSFIKTMIDRAMAGLQEEADFEFLKEEPAFIKLVSEYKK